ncbi:MAG TPA: histidine phosphatase family protein [Bacteroidia bacterium]
MNIGLVRHFKVDYPLPLLKLATLDEVSSWFNEYDNCKDLKVSKWEPSPTKWDIAFCSTMHRAKITAQCIYDGLIHEKEELVEFDIIPHLPKYKKLPFLFWGIISKKQLDKDFPAKKEFENKIDLFIDEILKLEEQNILIVSHWFVMQSIRKSLLKQGFTGPQHNSREYGKLYLYSK